MNPDTPTKIVEVALATPLRRRFDYLTPNGITPIIGARVQVPFGRQRLTGVILAIKQQSSIAREKLKAFNQLLDKQPLLDEHTLNLCYWASDYYQAPIGEVIFSALPTALRLGESLQVPQNTIIRISTEGLGLPDDALKRAPKQAQALAQLRKAPVNRETLATLEISSATIKALQNKGLITQTPEVTKLPASTESSSPALTLNDEQSNALSAIDIDRYSTYLLHGATGSGKTEVYLQAIAKVLTKGLQVLVLVPEIGLTPQTISRFKQRFSEPLVSMHSGLNDTERQQAWFYAKEQQARIIIGTRSAIFSVVPNLGMIIVDEEHDPSFKQQDGFRYSARDLACIRAQMLNIPVILGSATPALESLHNAQTGRFQLLTLNQRAGQAIAPTIEAVDIRGTDLQAGLCHSAKMAITDTLEQGEQALIFINRRGYAPAITCHDCGWQATCPNCSAKLTLHHSPRRLHCHHCDYQRPSSQQCPECLSPRIVAEGVGTERSEEELMNLFPNTEVLRIDRDSTRRKNAFDEILTKINSGKPCILVGTQMLAKGHHFTNVTLVVIADADSGFFSGDFRGPERTGQLLLQVAGRAGRAEKPGRVLVQSRHCDHPFIQTLLTQGYTNFAKSLLHERQLGHLPPFRSLALIKAEAKRADTAFDLLKQVRATLEHWQPPSPNFQYLGPMAALMERRQDRYRFQLQINTNNRQQLKKLLAELALVLEAQPSARQVRWAIDVDPMDMS